MIKTFIAFIVLGALTGGAAMAGENERADARIQAQIAEGGVELVAVLTPPNSGLSGEYDFTVRKQSQAGTSNVRQRGRFNTAAEQGGDLVLTRSTMGMGDDGTLKADLTVHLSNGRVLTDRYVQTVQE